VLAGAGLHHQQLVDLAAPMLEALPAGQDAADIEPASQYQGAHVQLAGSAPHANLILAFEYPGGWRDIQVIICFVLCVFRGWEGLQCLLVLQVLFEGLQPACSSVLAMFNGAHVQLAGLAAHANLILAPFEYPGGWRDIQVTICVCCLFGLSRGFRDSCYNMAQKCTCTESTHCGAVTDAILG
jgi:hypothetical protein